MHVGQFINCVWKAKLYPHSIYYVHIQAVDGYSVYTLSLITSMAFCAKDAVAYEHKPAKQCMPKIKK